MEKKLYLFSLGLTCNHEICLIMGLAIFQGGWGFCVTMFPTVAA